MKPAAIILAVFALGLDGCRDGGSAQPPGIPSAESFGNLPGLRETPDRELQNELARIVDEQATPEQLAQNLIPPEQNVAAGLKRLFLPSRVAATFEQSSEIYPQGRFAFNPVRLQRAIEFRKKYDSQHQHAREALARSECSFGIRFQDGFEAELGFIDVVRTCGRLEAFQAAEALAQDNLLAAIEAFGYLLRLAACLAGEKHVTCRLEAAFLRAEALAVLAAIVEHPSLAREHLAALSARLEEQLSRWPPDADAWIGDRALGMHAYEIVRTGRLADLLTPAEIDEFKREGIFRDLPAAAQRTVNQDELYYLRAMREIIDGCSRPFYARSEAFAAIRRDLQEKRSSPEFPIVAGRLLLADIENGQAIQAQDRAGCEAWALALALAGGRQESAPLVNPLTGQQYQVAREQGVVLVWDVLPGDSRKNPTVLVPDLAQTAAQE